MICVTNLSGLGKMMLVYRHEHGVPLPSETWCDALLDEEVKAESLRCPLSGTKEGQCSYALNAAAAGKDLRTLPKDMVLLFDSGPGWNQVGGPELLTMDNHKGEGCFVCFADGDARFIRADQVAGLRWTAEPRSPSGSD